MNSMVDEVDRSLLSELVANSKISIKELAKKLQVHPNTLFLRTRKLEKSGVITKYAASLDYDKLGYGVTAVVLMKLEMKNNWEEKLREISEIPQILLLMSVSGEADAFAVISATSKDEFYNILKSINNNPAVTKTTTHFVMNSYKSPRDFNPLKSSSLEEMQSHDMF